MQRIIKNATDPRDRTVYVEGRDLDGLGISLSGVTLRISGTETAVVNVTGTVTRIDVSALHAVVLTQAQSDSFEVDEEVVVSVPSGVNRLELNFVCYVVAFQVGAAPLSETDIGDVVDTALTGVALTADVTSARSAILSAIPDTTAIRNAIFAYIVEPGTTFLESWRAMLAHLLGETEASGTSSERFYGWRKSGTKGKLRLTITNDGDATAPNRTDVTTDLSDDT